MKMYSNRSVSSFVAAIIVVCFYFAGIQADAKNTSNMNEIQVSNVEELYAAVNDPQNTGVRILLLPGVYALSPLDALGQARPNGGRLELQADMSISGTRGHREAVVIEAVGLPAASFQGGPVPLAAIRTGRGRNAIEWLTVQNARFGQGNIVTTLDDGGSAQLRVAHIVSTGSNNNLSIANFGPSRAGKTMDVDVFDCDLVDSSIGLKQGFRIGNFSGSNGGVVNVKLIGNRIRGNQFSLIINNGTSGAAINVFSLGNRYSENGAGLLVVGGLNGASGSTITYSGNGDHFEGNDAPPFADQGGLFFVGGDRLAGGALGASNNTVNAVLVANRLSDNAYADLVVLGGRSFQPEFISTVTANSVFLRMIGMPRRSGVVEIIGDSSPDDPATGNSARVCRGIFWPRCGS
ncbi:MAG: hypothetical protein AB7V18_06075 [Pyrinomonadaceae bacterium]